MGGLEIGLAGMLVGGGVRWVEYLDGQDGQDGWDGWDGWDRQGRRAPAAPVLRIGPEWFGGLGAALTVFKALQLVNAHARDNFRDFVVVDLETTDRDTATAEIVEIAAARVRNWEIVEEFHRLVKPRVPIAPAASQTHGYTMADLDQAPHFEAVWPEFKAFVGRDVLVAHNGYEFDFPILRRMSGDREYVTYDTLPLAKWLRLGSARLVHLAERFGIDPGDPHKALWDVRTLARVFRKLEEEKIARTRRVALSNVLDHLGVALALSDPDSLSEEARLLQEITAYYALGRFTDCLEFYRSERERVGPTAAPVEELIERLGGAARMARVRAEKRPDQRYPTAMARVRRLLEGLEEDQLEGQIREFLGRVALSKSDGAEADPERVNLLTLHSTKGLEFSRVYIVGVEDSEMPGGPLARALIKEEVEESRRLLYVGMTRAKDRLVMTRVESREGRATGGHRFLDEMGITLTVG
jgi:DNA polymerase III epsilon subunit-like protein